METNVQDDTKAYMVAHFSHTTVMKKQLERPPNMKAKLLVPVVILPLVNAACGDVALTPLQHTKPVATELTLHIMEPAGTDGKLPEPILRASLPLLPQACPDELFVPKVKIARADEHIEEVFPTPTFEDLRSRSPKPMNLMDESGSVLRDIAQKGLNSAPVPEFLTKAARAPLKRDQARTVADKILRAEAKKGEVVVLARGVARAAFEGNRQALLASNSDELEASLGKLACARFQQRGASSEPIRITVVVMPEEEPAPEPPTAPEPPPKAPTPETAPTTPAPSPQPLTPEPAPAPPLVHPAPAPAPRNETPRPPRGEVVESNQPKKPARTPKDADLCDRSGACFRMVDGSFAPKPIIAALERKNADDDASLNAVRASNRIAAPPIQGRRY